MPIRILAFENNKIKSWVQVVTTFSKSENPCALLTIWLMSIPAASNVEPKACTEGLSFHAFDVQSKSAWNHQRNALTGVGQISVWSKHSRPMTFERKLKLSPLRFCHLPNRISVRTLRWMGMLNTLCISTIVMIMLHWEKPSSPYLQIMGPSNPNKKTNKFCFFNPHMFKHEKLQKPLFNLSAITDKGSSCNHMAWMTKNLIILCFPHVKKVNNL